MNRLLLIHCLCFLWIAKGLSQGTPDHFYNINLKPAPGHWGLQAAGGVLSVSLGKGRRLWWFADNFLGTSGPEGQIQHPIWLRNSACLQEGSRFYPLIGEADTSGQAFQNAFVRPPEGADDSSWYWPGQSYVDQSTHLGALSGDPGMLLISYNINTFPLKPGPGTPFLDYIIENPERYRSRFIQLDVGGLLKHARRNP